MVRSILTNRRPFLKGGGDDAYQTAHEALCAKLHQTRTVAEVASRGDLGNREFLHLVWCIADLLTEACDLCDHLTPQDFEAVE